MKRLEWTMAIWLCGCASRSAAPEERTARATSPVAAVQTQDAAPQAAVATAAPTTAVAVAPATSAPEGLRVVSATFTHRVEGRAPVDEVDRFAVGDRAVYHLVVENPGATTDVTIEWLRDGRVISSLPLTVGSSRAWRTWAQRWVSARDAAGVDVRVVDSEGNVLRTDRAAVEPAAPTT